MKQKPQDIPQMEELSIEIKNPNVSPADNRQSQSVQGFNDLDYITLIGKLYQK